MSDFKAKVHQIVCRLGLRPDPLGKIFMAIRWSTLTFDLVTYSTLSMLCGHITINCDKFHWDISVYSGDIKVKSRTHRQTDRQTHEDNLAAECLMRLLAEEAQKCREKISCIINSLGTEINSHSESIYCDISG